MSVTASPPSETSRPGKGARAWSALVAAGRRLHRDEQGATAIEYALMAMFFSVTVIGGSSSIRNALLTAFTTVSTAIAGATNG